jgi:chromosome partitioning protein
MRRIAVINQKGGVGKTTTTANLGAALAMAGHRVQIIDLDPQAHASLHLGVEPARHGPSVYDVLVGDAALSDVRRKVEDSLYVVGSHIDLAAAEVELAGVVGREVILRDQLDAEEAAAQRGRNDETAGLAGHRLFEPDAAESAEPSTGDARAAFRESLARLDRQATPRTAAPDRPGRGAMAFDYTLVDCPPSLGVLTLNALTASHEVLIPLQPHFLALHGMSKLLETIALVRRRINPRLCVTGIVLCMVEAGTRLAAEVVEDLSRYLESGRGRDVPWANARIFRTRVRRNIRLAECPSFGQSIFRYAPDSNGAQDYQLLAAELAATGEAALDAELAATA